MSFPNSKTRGYAIAQLGPCYICPSNNGFERRFDCKLEPFNVFQQERVADQTSEVLKLQRNHSDYSSHVTSVTVKLFSGQ